MNFKAILLAGALAAVAGQAAAQASTISTGGATAPSIGAASSTESNTFAVTGSVAPDCSFYTGAQTLSFDFGQLGIVNSSTQGIGEAFRLAGDSSRSITTSVAGCNMANKVTLRTNGNGMKNTSGASFQDANFTNEIEYQLGFGYTGNETGNQSNQRTLVFTTDSLGFGRQIDQFNGAWKSSGTLFVNIRKADNPKAPVAGTYSDTITLTLSPA